MCCVCKIINVDFYVHCVYEREREGGGRREEGGREGGRKET